MNTLFEQEYKKLKEKEKFNKANTWEIIADILNSDSESIVFESAEEYYNKAHEFIKSGLKGESEYCLQKAHELEPNNKEYLKELVKLEETQAEIILEPSGDNFDYIISLYDKLIILEPNDAEIHFQKALFCKDVFKADIAIEETEKAIKINDKNLNYYSFLGYLYEFNKNYAKAIDTYSKVIELNPLNIECYFYRAESYYKIKDYKNAYFDINRFIVFSKNSSRAYYLKYKICSKCKQYELALDNITTAINEAENNSDFCYMFSKKAELLHTMKKYKDEFICLIKAIKYKKSIKNYYKRLFISLLNFFK